MTRFRFRLQKILDLRQHVEEERSIELGKARRKADEARAVLTGLETLRARSAERVALQNVAGGNAGQLQSMSFVVGQLERRIARAMAESSAAEHVVEDRLRDFMAAVRDRRILERLRDRRQEAARMEEGREDLKRMNAVALSQYGRADGRAAGGQ